MTRQLSAKKSSSEFVNSVVNGGGYKVEQRAVRAIIHTQLGHHLRSEDLVVRHACQ